MKKAVVFAMVAMMAMVPAGVGASVKTIEARFYPGERNEVTIRTVEVVGAVYAKNFMVDRITELEGGVVLLDLIDRGGQVWQWESDSTDTEVGDIVSCVMDDMGTRYIDDDAILTEPNFDGWCTDSGEWFQW